MLNLYLVQGRARYMEGNPDEMVDEEAACRLKRRSCTKVNFMYERQRRRKRIDALSSLQKTASV